MVGRLLREGREPQAESDGRAGGEEAGDDRELIRAAAMADAVAGRAVGYGDRVGRNSVGGNGLHSIEKRDSPSSCTEKAQSRRYRARLTDFMPVILISLVANAEAVDRTSARVATIRATL